MRHKILTLSALIFFLQFGYTQEVLFEENFNTCSVPEGWQVQTTNSEVGGIHFGYPINPKSDSLSIDGTCMLIFDDDIIGDGQPYFRGEVTTPKFNISGYSTVNLSIDVHFRQYSTSKFEILVESDAGRKRMALFTDGNQTGTSFSESQNYSFDLRFFTDADEVSLVFVYDDVEMYAWWAGIDNIKVIGEDAGEILLLEQFDDCEDNGWSTEIIRGDNDWTLGYVENENASSNSMNGTCFYFFDDDGIGKEAAYSTAVLRSPVFDGRTFANYKLYFDLIFRKFSDFENISVYVNNGETRQLVQTYLEAVGGNQFHEYERMILDLSAFRSEHMQIEFQYEDGESWGWWVGLDNIKVIGQGSINDICSKAISISIGDPCVQVNNETAIFDGPEAFCVPNLEKSLWYRVTPDRDGLVQINNKSNFNDVINVYLGTCTDLEEVNCLNLDEHGFEGEVAELNLLNGNEYFVRIATNRSKFGASKGQSCLEVNWVAQTSSPPPNDILDNAIALDVDADCIIVDNEYASTDLQGVSKNDHSRADIWFSFLPNSNGSYKFLSDADFSDVLTCFEIKDDELLEVYSNEYGYGLEMNDLSKDKQYLIHLSSVFSTINGIGCVRMVSLNKEDVDNDDCFDAITLELDKEFEVTNQSASNSPITSSCAVYTSNDVWYLFNAEDYDSYYLQIDAEYQHVASLYYGDCDDLEEIWCSTNGSKCDGPMKITGLNPGAVYYLRIASNYTGLEENSGLVKFTLSTEEEDFEPLSISILEECIDNYSALITASYSGGIGDVHLVSGKMVDTILSGNDYLVIVQDSMGCEVAASSTVNCQNANCNLDIVPQMISPSCHTTTDGLINIEINNGLGPFDIQWSNGEAGIGKIVDLGAGVYSVQVIDANNCYHELEVELASPKPLSLKLDKWDETSGMANDGMAEIGVSGGTFPYSIDWSNGENITAIKDLIPGMYSVVVEDFKGCKDSLEFSILSFDCSFDVLADITVPLCHNGSDGVINLDSDVEIETAIWDFGGSGTEVTGLVPGEYVVTVTTSDNCQDVFSYEITNPASIEIGYQLIDSVSCHDSNDGSIDIGAIGGNGNLTYLWQDGDTSNMRNELAAGVWMVTVTDENNCMQSFDFMVPSPDVLEEASVMIVDLTCHDSDNGEICVFVEGGTTPYDFDWGDHQPAWSKLENLPQGMYSLTVTDSKQCTLVRDYEVKAPEQIGIVVEGLIPDSLESNDGAINILPFGGTPPYEFTWYSNGEVVGNQEDLSNILNGVYQVSVLDSNGCVFTSENISLMSTNNDEVEFIMVSVSPNPAQDYVEVMLENNNYSKARISIIDVSGRIKYTIDIRHGDDLLIDIEDFPSGSYYLIWKNNERVQSFPFVKVK